jgi:predicted TIM-barrel fold metal-dependent hydrolase
VIIDFHTHIFPPKVSRDRDEFARKDATFAEMYGRKAAKIATAEDLLASMDAAGVDVSVALGFAWTDHADIVRHNDYLLEAAAASNGRIIAFATVNMADPRAADEIARCAADGARGLGELRPDNQGWLLDGEAARTLTTLADELNLVLLFHVTEEAGHEYPGKAGCSLTAFREFALAHPGLAVVGAHLAGDAYRTPGPPDVFADTAAVPFLHRPPQQPAALAAVPPDRLLFGSDFPLITQDRAISELSAAVPEPLPREAALGGNAQALLGTLVGEAR